jgi:hypothetical protein
MFTAVNSLVAMVTMEHKQYKHTVWQGSPNNCVVQNFKMTEVMGLKINALRSP